MTPQDVTNGLYVPGSLNKKELYKLVCDFKDFFSTTSLTETEAENVGAFGRSLDPVLLFTFWGKLQQSVDSAPGLHNLKILHNEVESRMVQVATKSDLSEEDEALVDKFLNGVDSKKRVELLRSHGYID